MALPFLARRPDSGLGNIRSSPGDPSRNVDWVLFGLQAVLTIIGCAVVYSASRLQIDGDPYALHSSHFPLDRMRVAAVDRPTPTPG